MRPDDLRAVLLLKAIEETDRTGTVLPLSDREHATRDTLRQLELTPAQLSSESPGADLERAIVVRSQRLMSALEQRYPILSEISGREALPGWLAPVLLLAAFATGALLSTLDSSRRINILAFPFLGLILWNLLVYALLFLGGVRRLGAGSDGARAKGTWLGNLLSRRLSPLLSRTGQVHRVLGEALAGFTSQWVRYAQPMLANRVRQLFHLGAATMALGLIAGLYSRGLAFQYLAGWESTFLDAPQVRYLLVLLFGPASAWSGIGLPETLEQVEALRWTGEGGGGDAAPWMHLIALSLLIYVVIPRDRKSVV